MQERKGERWIRAVVWSVDPSIGGGRSAAGWTSFGGLWTAKGVPRDPANVALCTVSRGYGGRGARGGGGRSRGEASVRLPLSPRTLCAPGAGGGAHVHVQGAPGPGGTAAGTGNNPGTEEGSGLPDEPMVSPVIFLSFLFFSSYLFDRINFLLSF